MPEIDEAAAPSLQSLDAFCMSDAGAQQELCRGVRAAHAAMQQAQQQNHNTQQSHTKTKKTIRPPIFRFLVSLWAAVCDGIACVVGAVMKFYVYLLIMAAMVACCWVAMPYMRQRSQKELPFQNNQTWDQNNDTWFQKDEKPTQKKRAPKQRKSNQPNDALPF